MVVYNKMNNIFANIAMGIGVYQLYDQVKNVEKMDTHMKNSIILGIAGSSLWFLYQFNKYGMNMTTMYTTMGLIVQVYILNAILLKEIRT